MGTYKALCYDTGMDKTAVPKDPFDPWTRIPPEEFVARQEKVREEAARAGFSGAVVWSRGGAFMDMSQDVLYLTSHYSQQPYMGDEAGIGSARSHGVVILPVDGPTILIVDIPWWRRDLVVADDVRPSIDVAAAAAQAVRDAGLATGRLALVGASSMTAAAYLGFAGRLPGTDLVRADRLVERVRMVKSDAELDVIRRAATVGSRSMDAMTATVTEGATEAEAVAEASRVLIAAGGVLYDAACASGPTAAGFTSARLPSADAIRRFVRGDMFHVDYYGAYGGDFFDFARSRVVGDDPDPVQRALVEGTISLVEEVCAAIRPGRTAGEVYACGAKAYASLDVVRSLPPVEQEMEGFPAFGHGIGLMWEMPWIMPEEPTELVPGMCLGIEVLLGHPDLGGAMFEENGIVTASGFEILTDARKRWW